LSFQVFNNSFEKLIIFIAFIELSAGLMPLGAWIYTKNFDAQLISFIFWIKRFFVFLLLPFSIMFLTILNEGIKKYLPKSNDDKLRIKWIHEFTILLSILGLIILLPEIALFFNLGSFILFFLQGVIGAVIVIFIGLRNLNIQVTSSIETAKEINIYNPDTNRNFFLIKQLFEEEKIYTNAELRVSDIAQTLSLSPNYISKIINENANIGFNDFTNQFRVNSVIEKLKNNEHRHKTIFSLAQEAGFKSKSTFQTVFKKITGRTPTQFINEIELP
jgi:AraC-like DNA-binding protein